VNLLINYKECFIETEKQHSEFVAIDKKNNKTEYRIKNKSKLFISKIKADSENCIKEDGLCDFIFTIGKTKSVEDYFLIELKNSDLIKAVNQIDKTIKFLKLEKEKVSARVILTKTHAPDIIDNRVKKFKNKIQLGGGTFKHHSQYLEDIL